MHTRLASIAATLAFLAASAALAHSPYLQPNAFDVSRRDHVTIQASFTDEFFVPDIVMKAADWHVQRPDGTRLTLNPVYGRDLALLETETTLPGTYRLSTGLREGRTAKAALIDGEWKFLEAGAAAPAGGRVFDVQSLTRAEVYVTRGGPTAEVLTPVGQGLEFQALSHPNDLIAGKPARFVVLFDGKPLASQVVVINRGGARYAPAAAPQEFRSGADGTVTIDLPTPGIYHAMTRHRLEPSMPDGVAKSYTYALTLEATE